MTDHPDYQRGPGQRHRYGVTDLDAQAMRQAKRTREHREYQEKQERIRNCTLCNAEGYRGLVLCDHVDRSETVRRGMEAVRAALPSKAKTPAELRAAAERAARIAAQRPTPPPAPQPPPPPPEPPPVEAGPPARLNECGCKCLDCRVNRHCCKSPCNVRWDPPARAQGPGTTKGLR